MDKNGLIEQLKTSVKGIEDIISAVTNDTRGIDYVISDIEEEITTLRSALNTAAILRGL